MSPLLLFILMVCTITPTIVRQALYLPEHDWYDDLVGDDEMKRFLTATGYQDSLTKMCSLTRPNLRK